MNKAKKHPAPDADRLEQIPTADLIPYARNSRTHSDDYHAKTDKIGKYMIGMSVPPRMTETVARAVITQWIKPSSPASLGQHPDTPSDPSQ